jgi:hypothetical protein
MLQELLERNRRKHRAQALSSVLSRTTRAAVPLRRASIIKLRDHPLMSYRGFSTWPPVWTQTGSGPVKTLFGEIGVLRYAYSSLQPFSQCTLLIDYENQRFAGVLLFDNPDFCVQICNLLQANANRSIEEIADLDLSFTM